jgi:hypothetical protein
MFSLQKGLIPCIKIKGGKLDNKIISIIPENFSRIQKKNNINKPFNPNPGCKNLPKGQFKEIFVDDGSLQLIPGYKERDLLYVTGPSGCGKSTFCSKWIDEYKHKKPLSRIILISPITDDLCINKFNPIRIKLTEENFIGDNKITLDECANNLVVFDDVDAIPNRKIRQGVYNFRDEILLTGRHYNISSCSTSHIATDYKKTRNLLNESHFVCWFRGGSNKQITNFLKNYIGLEKDLFNKVMNSKSRAIILHTKYPRFILCDDYCYMLE